jgi:hypothetical protein
MSAARPPEPGKDSALSQGVNQFIAPDSYLRDDSCCLEYVRARSAFRRAAAGAGSSHWQGDSGRGVPVSKEMKMATYMEQAEWELLRLINEARNDPQSALVSRGLGAKYNPALYPSRGPLRMNIALRDAAHGWAQLMADRDVMGHNIDGRSDLTEGADAYLARFGVRPQVWVLVHYHWPRAANPQGDAENTVRGWLASDAGHRDYILGNTGSDTPLIGLGARESASGKVYVSGMISTAPGGFVDLYVKDNDSDQGLVPSTGVTYLSPAIRVRDAMNVLLENPEHGQDNYVFVEVRNAGTAAPSAFDVYLYWADPGTNLTFDLANPSHDQWREEGIHVDGVDQNYIHKAGAGVGAFPQEVGPFVWCPPDPETALGGEGHFCLFARVVCNQDPIMHEGDREYENNVAQRNVTVYPCSDAGECSCPIDLRGNSRSDVDIDAGSLLADGGKVYFRIRSHLLGGATLVGFAAATEVTPGGQITTLECSQAAAALRDIHLAAGQTSRAELRARLPAITADGTVYPITVTQTIDGRRVGSVTMVARMVGTPAYIGNTNSGELHYPNCQWVGRMSSHHKVPFDSLEVAHRRHYDNCAYCLGGSER